MTVPLRGNGFAVFFDGSLSQNTANGFSRVAAVPLYTYSAIRFFLLLFGFSLFYQPSIVL